MTTTDWIIDIVLILIVVRQLRREPMTLRFVLLPAIIVVYVAHEYLHGIPSGGNDMTLVVLAAAAGIGLGLVGGLLTRVTKDGGRVYVRAGWAAAGLWIVSMTARLGFIVFITHSAGQHWLTTFSISHHITDANTWQTALVLLALGEVIARIATIVVRGELMKNRPGADASFRASVSVR